MNVSWCVGEKEWESMFGTEKGGCFYILQSISSSFFSFFLFLRESIVRKYAFSHSWPLTENLSKSAANAQSLPTRSITDGLTDTAYFRCFSRLRAKAVRYYHETVHCNCSIKKHQVPIARACIRHTMINYFVWHASYAVLSNYVEFLTVSRQVHF